MNTTPGRTAGTLALVGAILLTAGCATADDAAPTTATAGSTAVDFDVVLAAAQEEGSLVIYSGFPESMQAALDEAFRAEHGLDVTTERLIQDAFAQRVSAEIESGQRIADVVIGSNALVMDEWRDKGWLSEIDTAALPELEGWPDDAWTGYWADIQPFIYGIAYNSDIVTGKDVPSDWADVADSPYADQTLLIDPSTGTTSVVPYQFLADAEGMDYLSEIAAGAQFVESTTPGLQSVGAGSGAIILPVASPVFVSQAATGLPLEIVYPDPTLLTAYRGSALDTAPHPNAASVYLNFLLSAEAQEIINAGGFSLRDDLDGVEPVPTSATTVDWNDAVENRDDIIAALTR